MEHNLEILTHLEKFKALKCPLVVGVSRKRFLGVLTDQPVAEKRAVASATAGLLAALRGADILRVHDVGEQRAALRVARAIL